MSKSLAPLDTSGSSNKPLWSPACHEARQKSPPHNNAYHAEHKHVVRLIDSCPPPIQRPSPKSAPPAKEVNTTADQRATFPNWESLLSTSGQQRSATVPIGQQKFGSSPYEMDSTSSSSAIKGRVNKKGSNKDVKSSSLPAPFPHKEAPVFGPAELIDLDELQRLTLSVMDEDEARDLSDDVEVLLTQNQIDCHRLLEKLGAKQSSNAKPQGDSSREDGEIEDKDPARGIGAPTTSPSAGTKARCVTIIDSEHQTPPIVTSIDTSDDEEEDNRKSPPTQKNVTTSTPQATTSPPRTTTSSPQATTSSSHTTTSSPQTTTSSPQTTTSSPHATALSSEIKAPCQNPTVKVDKDGGGTRMVEYQSAQERIADVSTCESDDVADKSLPEAIPSTTTFSGEENVTPAADVGSDPMPSSPSKCPVQVSSEIAARDADPSRETLPPETTMSRTRHLSETSSSSGLNVPQQESRRFVQPPRKLLVTAKADPVVIVYNEDTEAEKGASSVPEFPEFKYSTSPFWLTRRHEKCMCDIESLLPKAERVTSHPHTCCSVHAQAPTKQWCTSCKSRIEEELVKRRCLWHETRSNCKTQEPDNEQCCCCGRSTLRRETCCHCDMMSQHVHHHRSDIFMKQSPPSQHFESSDATHTRKRKLESTCEHCCDGRHSFSFRQLKADSGEYREPHPIISSSVGCTSHHGCEHHGFKGRVFSPPSTSYPSDEEITAMGMWLRLMRSRSATSNCPECILKNYLSQ